MLTKADFQRAIRDSISSYPAIAPLYQSGDPRVLQHLDAMATMLAMFSAQLETAMSEPFEKTRDTTVLADAAMRGIVRKATPARRGTTCWPAIPSSRRSIIGSRKPISTRVCSRCS